MKSLKERMIESRKTYRSTKEEIIRLFGEVKLAEAQRRLCDVCTYFCRGKGLPLNLDGTDCLYFKDKREK